MASVQNIPVGFYGSTDEVIDKLSQNITAQFPTLKLAFAFSPPFRSLTPDEDEEIVRKINQSGARILFVGLGCPKQERWMSEHRGRVGATMLGVGWAFDVVAGLSKTAPSWIQNIGMEWFYRLMLNPRKLWRRHLTHNPRFVVLILRQLWGVRPHLST
jgi:N-acetylglucosaminyldiphosphoundecaprenol N-acetyl-beta-D-mannosaminyltransferase